MTTPGLFLPSLGSERSVDEETRRRTTGSFVFREAMERRGTTRAPAADPGTPPKKTPTTIYVFIFI